MKHHIGGLNKSKEVCLECGSSRLKEEVKEQMFPFGPPAAQSILTASMPVFTCQDCGYEFIDERGESARHDAVCRHIGVQTPDEIRRVREATGLGRAEFCRIGGFGIASLQRWESGEVVPNASSDRLIYLLQYGDNLKRLRARDFEHAEPPTALAILSQQTECEALSNEELAEVKRRCSEASSVPHFPALERQGELGNCIREAERIRRRGCVLAPVA
jgi:putative zinc finger/helix-turn-helix YgiT family protein